MQRLKLLFRRFAVILALISVLASAAVLDTPVRAQTALPSGTIATNFRDSGSQPLPAGVKADVEVKTIAYMSFRPNPVGVGQTFLVNLWTTPALHAARYFKDFKVTIVKPSGKTEVLTMDSYRADTTAWFEYIADEEGTWKLKFEFPGAYFPAGNYSTEVGAVMYGTAQNFSFPQSCYYLPASTDWQELVVQNAIVSSWPESPLPSDYWTRPISHENREWWWIAGHFPWRGPGGGSCWPEKTNIYWAYGDRYRFIPWVQAPNTAHIVWKRQGAIGGLIGPLTAQQKVECWTTGGGSPSIIYQGRCYQTVSEPDVTMNSPSSRTYWMCYDLRTGELFWKRPLYTNESAPSVLLYYEGYPEVPGGEPRFSKDMYLVAISSGRLIGYNPWNGAVSINFSISPLTTGTYYMNGYWLTVQDLGAAAGANRYRLINWTIEVVPGAFMVSSATWRIKIVNNITWPWSSLGTTWDMESGIAVTTNAITPAAVGAWYGTNVLAASLTTGTQLWNKTFEETIYSSAATVADHGKVAFITMNGYWLGLNLRDGSIAWKSEKLDYPWDSPGFGAYGVASAYGLFYRFAYSGVYAFDWSTGKRVWKYEAPANPYETPYINPEGETVYSFNAAGWIADGKLYVYNTEHTPTQPITRGWRLHCINATTGEGIWNITGSMSPGAIADGYLV
ncbi:MAG: PQQ-binding-like beta-propeller repeat protein, partial [Candidatus Bathyarchaeia archaeon]